MADPIRNVIIDYTNWRGERALRLIHPLSIAFENSEWHPETQWMLLAVDVDKGCERSFALRNIHAWFFPAENAALSQDQREKA